MKKIEKNIEKLIDQIKQDNNNSCDINSRIIKIKNKKIGYIFLESVSSDDKISNFLMKSLNKDILKVNPFENIFNELQNTIYNSKMRIINNYDEIFYYLSSGFTCILVDGYDKIITVETKMKLDRGVQEANTESIVRGPKDGFSENYMINIGLIRKRIKDSNLLFDEIKIGRRTQTKVSITYLKDIVKKEKVTEIKDKLQKMDIDGLIDSGPIRDYLSQKNKSVFPKIISTERPDLCTQAILNGKIVIIVENTPFALIIPGLLIDIFQVSEDNYQEPTNVSITRLLKFLGFIITLITPAVYIAVTTYNFQVIPNNLLTSIAVQRQGVPFPTAIEIIIMLVTFEILRESDIRMPNQMGAAISIVGALVLGEAAVGAGIVSPIVVIVIALTSVSGLLFTDIDVVNAIRIWRFIFIIAATLLGLIGLLIAGIMFITKLASIEYQGTPYLSPLSPFNLEAQKNAIIKYEKTKIKKRPSYLHTKKTKKVGEE